MGFVNCKPVWNGTPQPRSDYVSNQHDRRSCDGWRGAARSRSRSSGAPTSPAALSYCRARGGRCFLWARYPCSLTRASTPEIAKLWGLFSINPNRTQAIMRWLARRDTVALSLERRGDLTRRLCLFDLSSASSEETMPMPVDTLPQTPNVQPYTFNLDASA